MYGYRKDRNWLLHIRILSAHGVSPIHTNPYLTFLLSNTKKRPPIKMLLTSTGVQRFTSYLAHINVSLCRIISQSVQSVGQMVRRLCSLHNVGQFDLQTGNFVEWSCTNWRECAPNNYEVNRGTNVEVISMCVGGIFLESHCMMHIPLVNCWGIVHCFVSEVFEYNEDNWLLHMYPYAVYIIVVPLSSPVLRWLSWRVLQRWELSDYFISVCCP